MAFSLWQQSPSWLHKLSSRILPDEQREHLIDADYRWGTEKHGDEPSRYNRGASLPYRMRKIALYFLLVTVFLMLGRGIFSSHHAGRGTTTANEFALEKPRYLHYFLQAPGNSSDLCKAVVSAAALDYPTPAIAGWRQTRQGENPHFRGVDDVEYFIRKLDEPRQDDMILLVDGTRSWMQLRPQVLLDRYYEIIHRGNQQLEAELGQTMIDKGIRQEIVFAAREDCLPITEDDPACYAAQALGKSSDKDRGSKPMYLSSGIIIGPAPAIRRLFVAAHTIANSTTEPHSLDRIFGQILADQQLYRESVGQQHAPPTVRLTNWASGAVTEPDDGKAEYLRQMYEAVTHGNQTFEYGFGIDHDGLLGVTADPATQDLDWLVHGDPDQMGDAAQARQMKSVPRLQQDVSDSLPPFWTFGNRGLPRERTWDEVPLLTNVRTGVTPAIVNRHSDVNLGEEHWKEWWRKMYFHDYARALWEGRITEPVGPVAVAGPVGEPMRQWWGAESWRGGVRIRNGIRGALDVYGSGSEGIWSNWQNTCGDLEEEIFADGKGVWKLGPDHP